MADYQEKSNYLRKQIDDAIARALPGGAGNGGGGGGGGGIAYDWNLLFTSSWMVGSGGGPGNGTNGGDGTDGCVIIYY